MTEPQMAGEYGRALAQLVTEDRFPAVHAALRDGLFDVGDGDGHSGGDDLDGEFEFGLQRILDGIEAYMARSPR